MAAACYEHDSCMFRFVMSASCVLKEVLSCGGIVIGENRWQLASKFNVRGEVWQDPRSPINLLASPKELIPSSASPP